MGFKRPQRTAKLDFEGTPFEGAEVTVNIGLPLGVFLNLRRLQGDDEDRAAMYSFFVEHCLVDWNLEEEDGSKTPLTLEGLKTWDRDLADLMVEGWAEAIAPEASAEDSSPLEGSTEEAELDLESLSKPL